MSAYDHKQSLIDIEACHHMGEVPKENATKWCYSCKIKVFSLMNADIRHQSQTFSSDMWLSLPNKLVALPSSRRIMALWVKAWRAALPWPWLRKMALSKSNLAPTICKNNPNWQKVLLHISWQSRTGILSGYDCKDRKLQTESYTRIAQLVGCFKQL